MTDEFIEERNADHIQSIERCMTVIASYTHQTSASTLSEVARRTGLSKPTARRILLTLERLGYVQQRESTFSLTPKMLELGYAYLSSQSLTQIAQVRLEQLTDLLDESTSLVALDGTDVIYVSRVHRHRITGITLAVGTRLPAHATSSGHVLLAGLNTRALERYLETANLKALTDRTIVDRVQLEERIAAVRIRGWDAVDQELEIGRRSIAVPIFDMQGNVTAALSLSCGTTGRTLEEMCEYYLPHLLGTASQISNALGHRPKNSP
ncbi:IclR family transcriptional regulator domain-containing protein [Pseudomonas moorei]|uniref:Transcriptional regulator, IclR family n=1 Tax=Pseudomonas moorei TaxID=395599 RepID=A0A1H1IDM8_9PSED|nr:IclR family transcriptional regulator C-terminal domain-containing protein [Pseudomonas moorei]KAB0508994.1 helix-turn-helix domain-containing protein [Pseudomonas moorei]SDR35436.1 transcriptional regulator, IclR family [Pseudomonas moorei]